MADEKQVVEQPAATLKEPVSPMLTGVTTPTTTAPVSPQAVGHEALPEVHQTPAPAPAPVGHDLPEPLPPAYQTPTQFDYPKQQPMSSAAPPVTPLNLLYDVPAWVDCPYCRKRTMTRVQQEDSGMTMLLGVLLCLICICAACIPCLAHWCADVDHFCTSCNRRLTHRPYNGVIQVFDGSSSVPSQYSGGCGGFAVDNDGILPVPPQSNRSQYAAGPDLENGGVRPPGPATVKR